MRYQIAFALEHEYVKTNSVEDAYKRQENLRQQENMVYSQLIEMLKSENGAIEDWQIIFPKGTPELAGTLEEWCQTRGYKYSIWARPVYSPKEIREARYVPLYVRGDYADLNKDWNPFNKYESTLCDTCGTVDPTVIPQPYLIWDKVVQSHRDFYSGRNGLTILSVLAFELLRDELEPWIDYGETQMVDLDGNEVKDDYAYVWIRPKYHVGSFTYALIEQICKTCGRPTSIKDGSLSPSTKDIFRMNLRTIESFKNCQAPIVLAGNWFGDIVPDAKIARGYHYYVFISGELHEKIRKHRFKGFMKADCVIHAADEEEFPSYIPKNSKW